MRREPLEECFGRLVGSHQFDASTNSGQKAGHALQTGSSNYRSDSLHPCCNAQSLTYAVLHGPRTRHQCLMQPQVTLFGGKGGVGKPFDDMRFRLSPNTHNIEEGLCRNNMK